MSLINLLSVCMKSELEPDCQNRFRLIVPNIFRNQNDSNGLLKC